MKPQATLERLGGVASSVISIASGVLHGDTNESETIKRTVATGAALASTGAGYLVSAGMDIGDVKTQHMQLCKFYSEIGVPGFEFTEVSKGLYAWKDCDGVVENNAEYFEQCGGEYQSNTCYAMEAETQRLSAIPNITNDVDLGEIVSKKYNEFIEKQARDGVAGYEYKVFKDIKIDGKPFEVWADATRGNYSSSFDSFSASQIAQVVNIDGLSEAIDDARDSVKKEALENARLAAKIDAQPEIVQSEQAQGVTAPTVAQLSLGG